MRLMRVRNPGDPARHPSSTLHMPSLLGRIGASHGGPVIRTVMSRESTTLTFHPQFRQQVLLFLDKYKPLGMMHPSAKLVEGAMRRFADAPYQGISGY